jgi:hypothetical protein
MLNRLLPRQADNGYEGLRAGLWLLAPVLLIKSLMGFNAIFLGRYVAAGADAIPLDRYGPEAEAAVLTLFALWGLGQLVLGLQGAIVLVRYRRLVPLLYLVLLFEHLARKLLFMLYPITRSAEGQPASALAINLAVLGLLAAGFVMSLLRRRSRNA